MIPRWQPPVLSPVVPRSLLSGLAAATGLYRPHADAVAHMLSEIFNACETLLTDSGTSALVLAIRALLPSGGTIALPSYACVDLTAATVFTETKVRLYDVDPWTLGPDPESVRRALSRGVDALVVAHLYGYPCDMQVMRALADQFEVPLIEDAAQSAGGSLNGVRAGAFGDLTILSFGRGKGTTGGAGGALLIRRAELLRPVERVRNDIGHASGGIKELMALCAQWMLARPLLYALPASMPFLRLGEMVYHEAHEPRSLTRAATAVLPHAMNADADEVRSRRTVADRLASLATANAEMRAIPPVVGAEPGYLRFAVLDVGGRATSAPQLGILRGYPKTLVEHSQLRPLLLAGEEAGLGARTLRDALFTLPTHSRVTSRDMALMASWLHGPGNAMTLKTWNGRT